MTTEKQDGERFRLRDLPSLIKETAVSWSKDDPWRLSAVVALRWSLRFQRVARLGRSAGR